MGILLRNEIQKEIENGKIVYTGDLSNISVNSIDVTLSPYIVTYFQGIIFKTPNYSVILTKKDITDILIPFLLTTNKHDINEIVEDDKEIFDIRNLGLTSEEELLIEKALEKYISEQKYIKNINPILDIKKNNPAYEYQISDEGLLLLPGILYLGATNEKAGSDYYIPMYEGRSSLARLGVASHLSAGFGDLGFASNWTLEISVIHPIKIYKNIRIGQIYFVKTQNPEESIKYYEKGGKYTFQRRPQKSLSFLDFEK